MNSASISIQAESSDSQAGGLLLGAQREAGAMDGWREKALARKLAFATGCFLSHLIMKNLKHPVQLKALCSGHLDSFTIV